MNTKSQISTPAPEIRDGKLIIDLSGGRHFEIDIDRIEELLELDVAKHCNDILLSLSQLLVFALQTISKSEFADFQAYVPNCGDLYILSLITETFKTNK